MNQHLAFIDTETTGLDPDRNPIWEIAVIVGGVEHVWQVRTPDGMPVVTDGDDPPAQGPWVSQWVIDNTGFGTRYNPADALHPADSARRFSALTDGRHLVGMVPSFDEERLRRMHDRELGKTTGRYPWHYHLIDIEAVMVGAHVARFGAPPALPWDSDELSRSVGVEPPSGDDRHTALGDARWARDVWDAVTRKVDQ